MVKRNSLAKKIFLRIAVTTAIATIIASTLAYYIVSTKTESLIFNHIEKFTRERARYEGKKFRLAERNHNSLKHMLSGPWL